MFIFGPILFLVFILSFAIVFSVLSVLRLLRAVVPGFWWITAAVVIIVLLTRCSNTPDEPLVIVHPDDPSWQFQAPQPSAPVPL